MTFKETEIIGSPNGKVPTYSCLQAGRTESLNLWTPCQSPRQGNWDARLVRPGCVWCEHITITREKLMSWDKVTASQTAGKGGKGSSKSKWALSPLEGDREYGADKSNRCPFYTAFPLHKRVCSSHTGNMQTGKSTWPKPRYGSLNPPHT